MFVIPFSVAPPKLLETMARSFKSVGDFLAALFPSLREVLLQAEAPYSARTYSAMAFLAAAINTLLLSSFLLLVSVLSETDMMPVVVGLPLLLGAATFFTIIYYPRVVALKRMRQLNNNLIPALRQLLIEIQSGVPLFNAMASVSNDYGEVSKEFKKMVDAINSGVRDLDALADASTANPSFEFRKALWQISNALKVGSDVSHVLEALIKELTKERIQQIKRYGSELSPWTMAYMMLAVIVPSLGVTMLIVLLTFLNISLPSLILPVIIVLLAGFQVFFINFVLSRRPVV